MTQRQCEGVAPTAAKYTPICIYCSDSINTVAKDTYPQCTACSSKPLIPKCLFSQLLLIEFLWFLTGFCGFITC